MDIFKNRSLNWSMKIGVVTAVTAVVTMGIIGAKSGNVSGGAPLSDGEVNQVVLHAENTPASLGSSLANADNNHIRNVDFDYFGAKASAGYHVELAANGFIGNDQASRLTSITSITVTYSAAASMKIATSNRDDGLGLNEKVDIASGVAFIPTNAPYYFRLYAGGVATSVVSVDICYTCIEHSASAYFLDNLTKQYTGTLGGTVFSLTRSGSSAVLATLNLASNISISDGVISLDQDEITISATGLTYVGTLSDNGRLISYKSASGAYAAYVNGLNMTSVYNLEDFESYAATGLGIRSAATGYYGHTGLRGAYYSDYYAGSGSSPISGTGWQLMGSTDYLDRYTSASDIHSGDFAGKMKRSSVAMRHVSWDLYTGAAVVVGKGDTMSLWAKGVASDVTIKPRVSYVSKITTANNQGTNDTAMQSFTVPANSNWTQYTFSIDPTKAVYGILITLEWGSSTVYLPVDDIQIYTAANPWATYVAPTGLDIELETADLLVGQSSTVLATISPANAIQSANWSSANSDVASVDAYGKVTGISAGTTTITATNSSYSDSYSVTVSALDANASLTCTYKGTTQITGNSVSVIIALASNFSAYMKIASDEIRTTYTISDNVVTIVTGNSNYGTFVGSLNSQRTTLTKTSLSGSYASYVGGLVMNASTIIEDGNNTTSSTLTKKYIAFNSDNMASINDADLLQYSSAVTIEGNGSADFKLRSSSKVMYRSASLSTLGTFSEIGLWIYNSTGESFEGMINTCDLNGSITYAGGYGGSFASNSTWTYYSFTFFSSSVATPRTVAGWALYFPAAANNGRIYVDYVNLAS